jgi:hypothetical protein
VSTVAVRVAAVWSAVLGAALAVAMVLGTYSSLLAPWGVSWLVGCGVTGLAWAAAIQLWRLRWSGLLASLTVAAYFIHCQGPSSLCRSAGCRASLFLVVMMAMPAAVAGVFLKSARRSAGSIPAGR